jgi:hypothetical protein
MMSRGREHASFSSQSYFMVHNRMNGLYHVLKLISSFGGNKMGYITYFDTWNKKASKNDIRVFKKKKNKQTK